MKCVPGKELSKSHAWKCDAQGCVRERQVCTLWCFRALSELGPELNGSSSSRAPTGLPERFSDLA